MLGLLLERLVFRHTLADHMQGLTASLGLIMVIENLAAPSRWNTLRALRVLRWWDAAA